VDVPWPGQKGEGASIAEREIHPGGGVSKFSKGGGGKKLWGPEKQGKKCPRRMESHERGKSRGSKASGGAFMGGVGLLLESVGQP